MAISHYDNGQLEKIANNERVDIKSLTQFCSPFRHNCWGLLNNAIVWAGLLLVYLFDSRKRGISVSLAKFLSKIQNVNV
jgi:hypothetical protein